LEPSKEFAKESETTEAFIRIVFSRLSRLEDPNLGFDLTIERNAKNTRKQPGKS